MAKDQEMPICRQARFPVGTGDESTSMGTAIPRSTEYDLEPVQSKTRFGTWGDEGTFKVVKKGNRP